MASLRSSSLTPFAPAVLASPVFVLAAAPLSPIRPHSDRTSRLPSLAVRALRALTASLARSFAPFGRSQARATA
jgi:hypothetical protein